MLPNASAQLNKTYFLNEGRKFIATAEYSNAINILTLLINNDTTLADAWFLRGVAKYNLTDLHGAKNDFTHAILNNPVFSQAYLYRGITLGKQSKYHDAFADFDMAIDLRPYSADGYYSRGINYLLMQRHEKSIEDFSRVIQLQPKNVDAWISRGSARFYNTDTLGAISDFTRAIQLNTSYPESYGRRGRAYFEMKEYQLAIDDLNKAIALDSTSSINYYVRSLTNNKLKRLNKSLKDINRSIEISSNNALSIYNRALLHWKLGDNQSALNDFNRVVNLNPENILVYYNRGILNYENDKFNKAIEDFSSALDIFPDFANALLARSSAYARLGDVYQSQKDKSLAHSIADKFSKRNSSPLTDTTSKFDELITFSSDFSTRQSIPFIDEFRNKSIDILPFYRVVVVPIEELMIFNQKNKSIDTLNHKLKNYNIGLTFLAGKTSIYIDTVETTSNYLNTLLQGISFSSKNRYNQSVNALKKSLEISPNNPVSTINLSAEIADMVTFIASFENEVGIVAIGQQQSKSNVSELNLQAFDESIELLNDLQRIMPNHEIINYNLGNIYALTNNMEAAKEQYSKSIETNPNMAEAWYNRGLIHLMSNNKADGCIDMGKAGELGLKQAYFIISRFCRQ